MRVYEPSLWLTFKPLVGSIVIKSVILLNPILMSLGLCCILELKSALFSFLDTSVVRLSAVCLTSDKAYLAA